MIRTLALVIILALGSVAPCVYGITIEQVPGTPGGTANFSAPGSVVVGADGKADFLVTFDPLKVWVDDPTNPFVYTTTLTWSQAADTTGISVNEWVRGAGGELGNLADFGIHANVTSTGASSGASFPGVPFPIVSYEVEVSGLQVGDTANFVKTGLGGVIVPEPVTLVPAWIGALLIHGAARKRRHLN